MENVQTQNTPKLTKKQIVDLRIQNAIIESENAIKDNPEWVTLENFYKELDNI